MNEKPGLSATPGERITLTLAANKLGISPRTLRLMCFRRKPEISYYWISGVYQFDSADIDAYIDSHRVEKVAGTF